MSAHFWRRADATPCARSSIGRTTASYPHTSSTSTASTNEASVPNPTREPFLAYLVVHASMLLRRDAAPGAAERLEEHAHALELLADLVRALPEDDERLLLLGSLLVRGGQL